MSSLSESMFRPYLLFLLPVLLAAPIQNSIRSENDIVPLFPQPRTVFHVDFFENGTSKEELPTLEVIPVAYLCDFCVAVIEMLKNMQKSDKNFEENMKKDCLSHNENSKEICSYVNKINLDRLKEGSPAKLCLEENLCLGQESHPKEDKKSNLKQQQTPQRRPRFYNRVVTNELIVEDIAR